MLGWLDIATLIEMKNLDGSFVVDCDPELPFLLHEGLRVALVPPVLDMPRSVEVASVRGIVAHSAKVRFAEITAPDQAEKLVGCHCLVRREDIGDLCPLPETGCTVAFGSDILSARDLIGWRLEDSRGNAAGRVVGVEDNPAHPLLVLQLEEEQTALVPFVGSLVMRIDDEARAIAMDLPAGLLDI